MEVTRPIIAVGYGPTPLLYRCQITLWRALLYRARTQAWRGLRGTKAIPVDLDNRHLFSFLVCGEMVHASLRVLYILPDTKYQ